MPRDQTLRVILVLRTITFRVILVWHVLLVRSFSYHHGECHLGSFFMNKFEIDIRTPTRSFTGTINDANGDNVEFASDMQRVVIQLKTTFQATPVSNVLPDTSNGAGDDVFGSLTRPVIRTHFLTSRTIRRVQCMSVRGVRARSARIFNHIIYGCLFLMFIVFLMVVT